MTHSSEGVVGRLANKLERQAGDQMAGAHPYGGILTAGECRRIASILRASLLRQPEKAEGKVRLPKQVSWNQAVVIIGETDGAVAGSSPHDFTQGWAACLKETKRLNRKKAR